MAERCILCGGRATWGDELPSGQPVCATCGAIWEQIEVIALAGGSTIAHAKRDCRDVKKAVSLRARGDEWGRKSKTIREKQFRQVPTYRACENDCAGEFV